MHCFSHCLNLCLQDAGRQIPLLRDALDIAREIGKLIMFSPKRSHLFNQKLSESESVVTVKSLCATRWTARTSSIKAVLKDYSSSMETMAEVNSTTHDEYGLKAGGILSAKCNTLFGLKLGYNLFGTAAEVSKGLLMISPFKKQYIIYSFSSAYYKRHRTDETFDKHST